MPRSITRRDASQRGYTITEVLVATAIFAVIFVAALLIYDRANKVFKLGVEASDMQQNARVAYDRLVADIRMAGFDHDRDGVPVSAGSNVWQATTAYGPGSTVSPTGYNGYTYRVTPTGGGTSGGTEPTWSTTIGGTTIDGGVTWLTLEGLNSFQQVDEQIEYAGTHAITMRANFDHDLDKANDYGREPALESVPFPVVTTGNDEIVTYALVSDRPAGAGINPDTITFFADVPDRRTYPGGRSENAVPIPDVDLCIAGCDSPPYTLVRFTLSPAGVVQRTPIATSIRSLEFTYYADVNGTAPLIIADAGGGQYNPITPATSADQRAARAGIRAVRIQLISMNEAPDSSYSNPDEAGTLAARYRTYRVESLVVPRNLGKQGMREQPSAPPGKPRMARVCINACRMAYVEWLAPAENPDQGLTEQYGITFDTVAGAKTKIKLVGAVTSAYVDNLIPGQNYYFSVSAINGFGSTPADALLDTTDDAHTIFVPGSATAGAGFNETTSERATNLLASGGGGSSPAEQPNQITVGWNLPTLNVAGNDALACFLPGGGSGSITPGIAPGEIKEWEVRRGLTADFDPNNPAEYTVVLTGAPNTISIGLTAATLVDKTAASCIDYYYRVRSKEACPGSSTQGGASNTSAWFPIYVSGSPNAVRGRSSAVAQPTAPISLLGTESCISGTDYDPATEVCNRLVWPKVKTDTATPIPNDVLIDTYSLEITRYRKPPGIGAPYILQGVITDPSDPFFVADPNGTNWLRKDTNPTTGVLYTSAAGNHLVAVHPSSDGLGADTYAYEYRIRALQCPGIASPVLPGDYTLVSDPSPAFRFPCEGSGTSTVDVTDSLDGGPGTSVGTAFLVQNGLSTVVVGGTNIASVQVYLTDLQNTTIANLGTLTAAPYIFPIDGTEDGQIYRVFALVKDTNGCTNVSTVFVEESTPSGCCLAAAANDPFVVQYTAGRRQFDVFFRNACDANLQLQTLGIKIQWDPSLTATGTVLESVVFPGGAVATVNDTTGSVIISVPAGGLTTVAPQAENYSVQLVFSQTLTVANVTGPLTGFCVTYRRTLPDGTVLDIEDQNCKIVPQPAIFNSCSS